MRKTICIEGKKTVPGQFLETGSLKWEEGKQYPITWEYKHDKIYGWASDIRREDDGTITAELDIEDGTALALLEHRDVSATIYGNKLVGTKDEEVGMSYSSVNLLSISLVVAHTVNW